MVSVIFKKEIIYHLTQFNTQKQSILIMHNQISIRNFGDSPAQDCRLRFAINNFPWQWCCGCCAVPCEETPECCTVNLITSIYVNIYNYIYIYIYI